MIISKSTLNLGCGPDSWGELRVDIDSETQAGEKSRLNIRADAHHLPFRNNTFSMCRCWHVLEHAENPSAVLSEIQRVSEKASIRFPVDEGYYRQMIIGLLNLDRHMFVHAYLTLKRRAHKWIIKPFGNAKLTDRCIEYPRPYGRKGKLVTRTGLKFRYYYEYEVTLP